MRGDLTTVLPQALAHRQRTTLARPDKTVAAVLVASAVLASLVPASRAAKVDVMQALRTD